MSPSRHRHHRVLFSLSSSFADHLRRERIITGSSARVKRCRGEHVRRASAWRKAKILPKPSLELRSTRAVVSRRFRCQSGGGPGGGKGSSMAARWTVAPSRQSRAVDAVSLGVSLMAAPDGTRRDASSSPPLTPATKLVAVELPTRPYLHNLV